MSCGAKHVSDTEYKELEEKPNLSFDELNIIVTKNPQLEYVLGQYERWMNTKNLLSKLIVQKTSYLANADVFAQLDEHESYIIESTTPRTYLLSARFLEDNNRYSGMKGKCLLQQWLPYVRAAMDHAQPHPFMFSPLMWHNIDHLEPMVNFLEKMCTSRIDGRMTFVAMATVGPLLTLPVELRYKIFCMAVDDTSPERKGNRGIELLLHWMFHVWGTGPRVPHRGKLQFTHLGEAEAAMASF